MRTILKLCEMFAIDPGLVTIVVVMACGTAFGQQDDLAELFMEGNPQLFELLMSKGVVLASFEKRIERILPILVSEVSRKLPADATDEAKGEFARRQVNAALVLLHMNRFAEIRVLLKQSPNPTLRSYLIHSLGPLGIDAGTVIKRLDEEPDGSIRRALILSLGEFKDDSSLNVRGPFSRKLMEIYRDDGNPGVHAASEWLLQHWNHQEWMKACDQEWANGFEERQKRLHEIEQSLAKEREPSPLQWYVDSQNQTMVVIAGPVEFVSGSPKTEAGRMENETQHQRRIDRNFAIAAKEVTVDQFLRFNQQHDYDKQFAPITDCPVNRISWSDAAAYCNWLSYEEGIPKEQWCYEPDQNGKYDMATASNFLQRTGYRLPTEAEWEYACRAGSETRYSCGESDVLLGKYAWFSENSLSKSHPVGSSRPNDFGLFDMHGNISEWCHIASDVQSASTQNSAINDKTTAFVLRGGSFGGQPALVRSANRSNFQQAQRGWSTGLRVARTLPPDR